MVGIAIALAPVLLFLVFFIKAARSVKKGSGSMTGLMLGATDNLLTQDKKRAAEVVMQQKTGTKLEEQASEGTGDI